MRVGHPLFFRCLSSYSFTEVKGKMQIIDERVTRELPYRPFFNKMGSTSRAIRQTTRVFQLHPQPVDSHIFDNG
jgi:hypothetical protein